MTKSVLVGKNLRFDARLAVIHETERWLAIADLHYGYELSLRAAGALLPAWGMLQIEQRLHELITDYKPESVVFLGDLVHTADASGAFAGWVEKLRDSIPRLILIRGNHDHRLRGLSLHDQWRHSNCVFHHGHQTIETDGSEVLFSGHLHPSRPVSDGAGLTKNLPALCQTPTGWILPAFSPWAAGGGATNHRITGCWISNHRKVLRIQRNEAPSGIFV